MAELLLEFLKSKIAYLVKERKKDSTPEVRFLLPGLAFPTVPKGEGTKAKVGSCACVWGGTDFPANTPVWSSREAPFIGDRLGRSRVPCREQLCWGLQGLREAQHWFGKKQGKGRAIIPDCCWDTKGRKGWFCFALLTSHGQETLLALEVDHC